MAKETVTVTVDPINRGIDRYDTDIRRGKIVEGLNVINDDGDLRRRDSFKSIYTAAPHYFPPGLVQVYFSDGASSGESVTLQSNRSGTISTSVSRIYVGCEEKFDGFELGVVSASTQTPDSSIDLQAFFRTGAGTWEEIDWLLNTTSDRHGSSDLVVPWTKEGRISWHSQDIEDNAQTWAQDQGAIGRGGATLGYGRDGSTKLFWVCIEAIQRGSTTLTAPTASITVSSPGVRCFELSRINGLFPIRTKGKSVTVVCSDRLQRRGSERGAMIGSIEDGASQTKRINFASTQGSGVMDVLTWPDYEKTGSGNTTYAASGLGTTNVGSSDVVTRMKQPTEVDWFAATTYGESEWRGGKALQVPAAGLGAATTSSKIIIKISSCLALTNAFENQYEHFLMKILDDGDSEAGLEERMIYKNTASDGSEVIFHVDDAFSGVPNGSVYIYYPHNRIRLEPSKKDYEVYTNEANTVEPLVSRPWAPETTDVDNKPVHYYIGPNPRWFHASGQMYSSVFSLGDQKLILSNGEGPLITFDGKDLRVMVPHSDVTTDYIAALYAGMVGHSDEQISELASNGLTEKGKLRSNPLTGETLTVFNDHVFMSNADDVDYQIMYSGGMKATDVWPQGYSFFARDEESRRIQGMKPYGSILAIWTASEIMGFRFGRTDADRMVPVALSPGFGFMSHDGVQRVRGALVGPNSDGIYAFQGREPTPIVDDWKRIIKTGVNVERLDRATAVNLYHKSWYILAVPQAGSNKNDRLVVWDYARNQIWVWSAPYGASFLARDLDENGSERLLVGTDDGYVQTLVSSELDDAKTITSHARTPPMNPFGPNESALVELQVTAENKSSAQPLKCKIFVAKRDAESKSIDLSTDASQSVLSSFTLDTSEVGDERYKTKKASLNAKGHDFQVEVGGQYQWRLRRLFITARPLGRR